MIRSIVEKGLTDLEIHLDDECFQMIEVFVNELKKWNKKINLTAICDDTDIAIKHIIDSLVLTKYLNCSERILDIGSGAGFPAIPLKIATPGLKIVSVDAVGKKINFQRHVSRLLMFSDFDALHTRAENIHLSHAGNFDVILSRAFSNLELFVKLAAPLLKKDGRMIAMKGPGFQNEHEDAKKLRLLGFEIKSVYTYSLPLNKGIRNLVTITAVEPY